VRSPYLVEAIVDVALFQLLLLRATISKTFQLLMVNVARTIFQCEPFIHSLFPLRLCCLVGEGTEQIVDMHNDHAAVDFSVVQSWIVCTLQESQSLLEELTWLTWSEGEEKIARKNHGRMKSWVYIGSCLLRIVSAFFPFVSISFFLRAYS